MELNLSIIGNLNDAYLSIIIILTISISCSAQSVCEQLHQLKQKYYGFTPRHFAEKEFDAKLADLDKFWDYAKANKAEAKVCLKDMILVNKFNVFKRQLK